MRVVFARIGVRYEEQGNGSVSQPSVCLMTTGRGGLERVLQ